MTSRLRRLLDERGMYEGVDDLLARDPDAYWDTATNRPHRSMNPSQRILHGNAGPAPAHACSEAIRIVQ
jgi:hypothetical protein